MVSQHSGPESEVGAEGPLLGRDLSHAERASLWDPRPCSSHDKRNNGYTGEDRVKFSTDSGRTVNPMQVARSMNNTQAFAPPHSPSGREEGEAATLCGRVVTTQTEQQVEILHWIVGERQQNAIQQSRAGRTTVVKF